jgi:hypothetical protein
VTNPNADADRRMPNRDGTQTSGLPDFEYPLRRCNVPGDVVQTGRGWIVVPGDVPQDMVETLEAQHEWLSITELTASPRISFIIAAERVQSVDRLDTFRVGHLYIDCCGVQVGVP